VTAGELKELRECTISMDLIDVLDKVLIDMDSKQLLKDSCKRKINEEVFTRHFSAASAASEKLLNELAEAMRNVATVSRERRRNILRRNSLDANMKRGSPMRRDEAISLERLQPAILSVEVVKARNLPSVDAKGSLNPFVILKVGTQLPQNTTANRMNRNPVWRAQFYWKLLLPRFKPRHPMPVNSLSPDSKVNNWDDRFSDDAEHDSDAPDFLYIAVMDSDFASGNDTIGHVYIPLSSSSSGLITTLSIEGWFPIMRTPTSPIPLNISRNTQIQHNEVSARQSLSSDDRGENRISKHEKLQSRAHERRRIDATQKDPFFPNLGELFLKIEIKLQSSQNDIVLKGAKAPRNIEKSSKGSQLPPWYPLRGHPNLKKAVEPFYDYESEHLPRRLIFPLRTPAISTGDSKEKLSNTKNTSEEPGKQPKRSRGEGSLIVNIPSDIETPHARFENVTLTVSGKPVSRGRLVYTDYRLIFIPEGVIKAYNRKTAEEQDSGDERSEQGDREEDDEIFECCAGSKWTEKPMSIPLQLLAKVSISTKGVGRGTLKKDITDRRSRKRSPASSMVRERVQSAIQSTTAGVEPRPTSPASPVNKNQPGKVHEKSVKAEANDPEVMRRSSQPELHRPSPSRKSNRNQRNVSYCVMRILCYDFRQLDLVFWSNNQNYQSRIYDMLDVLQSASCTRVDYADRLMSKIMQIHPRIREKCEIDDRFSKFDIKTEMRRQKLDTRHWRYTLANSNYKLCDSYPSILVVPRLSDDYLLEETAKFRSKARLPVLTWYDHTSGASICRCAQPRVGLGSNTSVADEEHIRLIRTAGGRRSRRLVIIDCRSQIAADANSLKGKGTEIISNYPFCKLLFQDIGNLHAVRHSLNMLRSALISTEDDKNWLLQIHRSGWLGHNASILSAATRAAYYIKHRKSSVIIHCSDGWDRTAQVSSLAQLLLDPFYRTIKGFIVLINKDWVSFGHKFKDRLGEGRESSPVFHQFLDCVWQVTTQFPDKFQFNQRLLRDIVVHIRTNWFSNFYSNSEKESCERSSSHSFPCHRHYIDFEGKTKCLDAECHRSMLNEDCGPETQRNMKAGDNKNSAGYHDKSSYCQNYDSYRSPYYLSLWSFILSNSEAYSNPFYDPEKQSAMVLLPIPSMKVMKIWPELYLKYDESFLGHIRYKVEEEAVKVLSAPNYHGSNVVMWEPDDWYTLATP